MDFILGPFFCGSRGWSAAPESEVFQVRCWGEKNTSHPVSCWIRTRIYSHGTNSSLKQSLCPEIEILLINLFGSHAQRETGMVVHRMSMDLYPEEGVSPRIQRTSSEHDLGRDARCNESFYLQEPVQERKSTVIRLSWAKTPYSIPGSQVCSTSSGRAT